MDESKILIKVSMSLNSSQKTICVEDSNGMQMCDEPGGGGGGNSRVWKSPRILR